MPIFASFRVAIDNVVNGFMLYLLGVQVYGPICATSDHPAWVVSVCVG
jgi:hypothetical protein